MSKIALEGNASGTGTFTIASPNSNSNYTLTLPSSTGTVVVTGGAQTIEFAAGSAASPSITFTGDTNTGIFSPGADTIAFAEGGAEAMRIDSSGNVGIGTSSPVTKLDVRSTSFTPSSSASAVLIEDKSAWAQGLQFYINSAGLYNSSRPSGAIGAGNQGSGVWYTAGAFLSNDPGGGSAFTATATSASMYRQAEGTHVWYTNTSLTAGNTFTQTERARITSGGNLLVGTTTDAGSTSNTTPVVAGAFRSFNGSVTNTTINVATNLVTLPSGGMFLFRAYLGGVGTPANSESLAIITCNAGAATQTNLKTGSWIVINLSGLTVTGTQNQATGYNISWSVMALSG